MTNLKFAFVFPGQGSQSIGMLNALAETYPTIIHDTFTEASQQLGYDLWERVSAGPAEALNQTEITQPAMLTADVATWRIFCAQTKQRPAFLAGHSLGEYAALVAAEALPFAAAVTLVETRARLMQAAMPAAESGVAAILGLTDDVVREICQQASTAGLLVSPANYNAKGQVVIAGHRPAVLKAMELAEAANAMMAKLIPVSTAVHTALMAPAGEKLFVDLQKIDFNLAKIPVIHNVDLSQSANAAAFSSALARQVSQPVRWVETLEWLHQQNIEHVIECGPGKVLMKLVSRTVKSMKGHAITDQSSLQQVIQLVES